MKQKTLFLQAIPFAVMLAVLSISRIIFEFTYSETSYVITTVFACVISVIIMIVAMVMSAKAKAYLISSVSVAAIIFLLVKLLIAVLSVKLDFELPLSIFEIIFLFVLFYFLAVGIVQKNIISLCLTFIATAAYFIMWILPDTLISIRNSIGFNTYFNSHEIFAVLFGWIILLIISVISHLFSKRSDSNTQGV